MQNRFNYFGPQLYYLATPIGLYYIPNAMVIVLPDTRSPFTFQISLLKYFKKKTLGLPVFFILIIFNSPVIEIKAQ